MGSGSREYQYTIRFVICEKQQEEGISREYIVYNFGEYTVLIGDKLVLLYKQNVLVSTYNKDYIKFFLTTLLPITTFNISPYHVYLEDNQENEANGCIKGGDLATN